MKSHIYFTSECQVKSLEESKKVHRKTGEVLDTYWKVEDQTDFQYFIFSQQAKTLVPILESVLPEDDKHVSPPLRLEGYVTRKMSGTFLTILSVFEWDSSQQTYVELKTPRRVKPQTAGRDVDLYADFDPDDEPLTEFDPDDEPEETE